MFEIELAPPAASSARRHRHFVVAGRLKRCLTDLRTDPACFLAKQLPIDDVGQLAADILGTNSQLVGRRGAGQVGQLTVGLRHHFTLEHRLAVDLGHHRSGSRGCRVNHAGCRRGRIRGTRQCRGFQDRRGDSGDRGGERRNARRACCNRRCWLRADCRWLRACCRGRCRNEDRGRLSGAASAFHRSLRATRTCAEACFTSALVAPSFPHSRP